MDLFLKFEIVFKEVKKKFFHPIFVGRLKFQIMIKSFKKCEMSDVFFFLVCSKNEKARAFFKETQIKSEMKYINI